MASDRPFEGYGHVIDRVNSFNGWPLSETHDPKRLASVGFVYTGEGTLVRCIFCGIKYRDWKKGDNPFAIHKTCNPRCPFLQTLACKRKGSKQELSSLQQPLHYNSHMYARPSCQATSTDYDNLDNTSALEISRCTHKGNSLVAGWALNKVIYPGQNEEENMHVEVEKRFFEDHFHTFQHHQSTASHYQQSAALHLTGYLDLMAFPDNSLPQRYCEQSELEKRGGIHPFECDSTSEVDPDDVDQPHTQQIAVEKHISSRPVSLMHKKPLPKLSTDDILRLCNVDFSNLWMVGPNYCVQMQYSVESKNSNAVSSSVSLSSDENNKVCCVGMWNNKLPENFVDKLYSLKFL